MSKAPTTPGSVHGSIPRPIALDNNKPVTIHPQAGRRKVFLHNESTTYKARVSIGKTAASPTHGFPLFPSGGDELETNADDITVCADQAAITAGATVTVWVTEEFDA